ncbi:MAG: hypothetical protein R2771_00470 [Saprospiraceae bacterium]
MDTFYLDTPIETKWQTPDIFDIGCGAGDKGSIEIPFNGGDLPLTVTMGNDIKTVTSLPADVKFRDLDKGLYVVYIENSKGCLDSIEFEIKRNENLLDIDSLSYALLGCGSNSVTDIEVYVSNANGNVTYNWYTWVNGDSVSLGNSNILQNVGEGQYFIEVKDDQCISLDSVELKLLETFSLDTPNITPAECGYGESGGDPGSICINVVGGNSGYNFNWSNGENTNCISGDAGEYLVTVTDAFGCVVKDTLEITGSEPMEITVLAVNGISCNDGNTNDGSVAISASGGNNKLEFIILH